MRAVRRCLAFALALTGIAVACTSPSSQGAGGSDAGAGGALGAGGASPAVAACASCLDTQCAAEKAGCDADCYAIQACLDAICFNLSATGASDEGSCQVRCQALHPYGIAAHLAYVNCVYDQPDIVGPSCSASIDAGACTCIPPCAFYGYDYDACVAAQNAGACADARAACTSSSDCTAYQKCAGACTTLAACEACAATAGGAAGEQLYEAYQLCLDTGCFAQGWLPHY